MWLSLQISSMLDYPVWFQPCKVAFCAGCLTRNIGVELNLAVDKINHVSPNYIPPTFNTCIKTSVEEIKRCQYYLIIPLIVHFAEYNYCQYF